MKAPNSAKALREAQCSLLLVAAGGLRRRYVYRLGDSSLSPAAAEELANIFEGIARNQPGFDKVDRTEAVALAHRLVDDDYPEHSRMWPTERAG